MPEILTGIGVPGPSSTEQKQQEIEQKQNEVKNLFEKVLKGRFDRVPSGRFMSVLPGLESITITRPLQDKPEGQRALYATLFFKREGDKIGNETWTFAEDGRIIGRVPKALSSYSREEIASTVLETIDKIGVGFWHPTVLKIFPLSDVIERGPGTGPVRPGRGRLEDPERLKFYARQPQALFGFYPKAEGLAGYHGALWTTFAIFDHPLKDNAAFIADLPKPIDVSPAVLTRPPGERFSWSERDAILEEYVKPVVKTATSRGAFRSAGAEWFRHTPDRWQEQLQAKIDARPSGPAAAEPREESIGNGQAAQTPQ